MDGRVVDTGQRRLGAWMPHMYKTLHTKCVSLTSHISRSHVPDGWKQTARLGQRDSRIRGTSFDGRPGRVGSISSLCLGCVVVWLQRLTKQGNRPEAEPSPAEGGALGPHIFIATKKKNHIKGCSHLRQQEYYRLQVRKCGHSIVG